MKNRSDGACEVKIRSTQYLMFSFKCKMYFHHSYVSKRIILKNSNFLDMYIYIYLNVENCVANVML